MKVIIFGVNGMAGHMAALYLAERGHQVTGFARRLQNLGEGIVCIEIRLGVYWQKERMMRRSIVSES